MNDKAEEIGCSDTYFITPNGLDATNQEGFHHTTAEDLANIMHYCIRISDKAQEFLTITGTAQYVFTDIEGNSSYSCYNHNAFLQMMEGALSGKTGFTGNAGYCYVGVLERGGRTYIVALLACGWPNNKSYKWSDTKKLMNYGLSAFVKKSIRDVEVDESRLLPIEVENGQTTGIGMTAYVTPVVRDDGNDLKLLLREEEEITISYELADYLQAPVEEGSLLGMITYRLGDEVLKEYRVEAANSVERIDMLWCMQMVLLEFFFR